MPRMRPEERKEKEVQDQHLCTQNSSLGRRSGRRWTDHERVERQRVLQGVPTVTRDASRNSQANFFFFFFFLVFLGLHLRHMEVPRLGVESEL